MELIYRTDESAKFWRIAIHETTIHVQFGILGTQGQSRNTVFVSDIKAQQAYRMRICSKLIIGYKPDLAIITRLLNAQPPPPFPEVIAAIYVAEMLPDEMITDLCAWMTCCLMHGMAVRQFERVWNRLFEDQDNELLNEALGRTEDSYWVDHMGVGVWEVPSVYARAVHEEGTQFLWYNNNGDYMLIALRGDPGAEAIERVVYEDHFDDEDAQAFRAHPVLGPGAPIASMGHDQVWLRDGTCYSFDGISYAREPMAR